MEKGRNSKIIAIVALCVGVVGLSLGFAAFSSVLTISSSAEVKPDASTFNVDFSTVNNAATAGTVTPTGNGEAATIDNSGDPTITGLKANFTEPGQTVVYEFFAYNAGEYEAFLNSIVFGEVSEGKTKVCTAKEGTSQALVNEACAGVTLTVEVGGVSATTSQPTISSHSLAAKNPEAVKVTIAYAEGSARADGDFDVTFGDVTLTYGSVD